MLPFTWVSSNNLGFSLQNWTYRELEGSLSRWYVRSTPGLDENSVKARTAFYSPATSIYGLRTFWTTPFDFLVYQLINILSSCLWAHPTSRLWCILSLM